MSGSTKIRVAKGSRPDGTMPNKKFAETDHAFQKACEKAGIPATARQAGKYRRGQGKAYKARKNDFS